MGRGEGEHTVLTSKHQREGDFGLGQQRLHAALEELQGLAFATARVQQHQHAAGPREQRPGAASCENKPGKAASETRH